MEVLYLSPVAGVAAAELLLGVMISGAFAAQSARRKFLANCARCHSADSKGKDSVSPGVSSANPADLWLFAGDGRRRGLGMAKDDRRNCHRCGRETQSFLPVRRIKEALGEANPTGA